MLGNSVKRVQKLYFLLFNKRKKAETECVIIAVVSSMGQRLDRKRKLLINFKMRI